MRLRRWFVFGSGLVGIGLLGVLYQYARVATGYAALVGGICVFATGDSVETIRSDRLRMPFGLERFVSLEVDHDGRSVRSRFLGVVGHSAHWHDELGATRGDERVFLDVSGERRPGSMRLPLELDLEFDTVLERAFAAGTGTMGAAVFLEGVVVAERYRDGYDATTPLLGWSMTKTVTAALVGRALELGALESLDVPMEVPEWSEGDSRRAITLRQCLTMQSGLQFDSSYLLPWNDSLQMLFVTKDVGAFAAEKSLVGTPGVDWAYSDGTSNLVARFLQVSVGASFPERVSFPRRALFDPLGMSTAVISVDATGVFVGSSLATASTHDWLRFGAFLANDGVVGEERLLPEGFVEFLANPGSNPDYGAHVWRFDVPASHELHGAFFASGYGQQVLVVDRERKLVFARLGVAPDEGRFDVEGWATEVVRAADRKILGAK